MDESDSDDGGRSLGWRRGEESTGPAPGRCMESAAMLHLGVLVLVATGANLV